MAQNALTVTAANPTPPTNLTFVGNTAPLDSAQPFVDDGIARATPNATQIPGVGGVSATPNTSTLNEDSTITTWPTAITFATSTAATNTAGSPGAGISNTHEARGTETSSTATSPTPNPIGQLKMVGVGPAAPAAGTLVNPNALHASSFTPVTALTPTTSAATGVNNSAASTAPTVLTVTGTNFNRTSVVRIDGVRQTTQYVSTTSLTVTNAVKRTTAGNMAVTVVNDNSGITSTPATNWVIGA
jgi:hypothetical protein